MESIIGLGIVAARRARVRGCGRQPRGEAGASHLRRDGTHAAGGVKLFISHRIFSVCSAGVVRSYPKVPLLASARLLFAAAPS